MSKLTEDQLRLLRAIPAIESASATPHTQALATETGLRVDEVETLLHELVNRGLAEIQGVGTGQQAWLSQPAYRLTDAGRGAAWAGDQRRD